MIFPGVGEASTAMEKLKASGLDVVIPQLKQPVLGICLGMQLMCNATEEGNTTGLGIFKTRVKRFSNSVKVPQVGWNTIRLKITIICIWFTAIMRKIHQKQLLRQRMI